MHPWATLKTIQHLNKLPDRRISQHRRNRGQPIGAIDPTDPIRTPNGPRDNAYYKAIGLYAFEDTRPDLYAQFFEMDFDAIISQVLDAFATEATQVDYERRRVVWVESNNADIQRILTKTLDRLKIDYRAFPICRSLARDGDVMAHLHGAANEGVVAIKPYKPFQVARLEDSIGRLLGFCPADSQGFATQADQRSIQAYQGAHWRLPPRDLEDIYGVESSFLWGSRVVWRELQMMLDQVVLQRLLRRPDRLAILMDCTGMSHDEAMEACKDLERRLYRETYANVATGEYHSHGFPVDLALDVVIPRAEGNDTTITNLPATNTNDLLRDLDLLYQLLAGGIGFPLGFIGKGAEGGYNPGQTLSRQSQQFAKKCGRLQQAFLQELVRICMIDLAWNNVNPFQEKNAFSLHMASVSPIIELERSEVLQLRLDRMERGIHFGTEAGFMAEAWIPYVLEFWGGLPRDVISRVYPAAQYDAPLRAQMQPTEGRRGPSKPAAPDYKAIEEALLKGMGTPADAKPIVDSSMFSPKDVFDKALTEARDAGGQSATASTMTQRQSKLLVVEATEFDVIVEGEKYKAVKQADNETYKKSVRMRTLYRQETISKIARRVL